MKMGGGGSGYQIPAHMTRVAAAPRPGGGDWGFIDVLADFSKRIETAPTLDVAVSRARELSAGTQHAAIAVLPEGAAFSLFHADVRDVADTDRPTSSPVALETHPAVAAAKFHSPQLAALVDGAATVARFDRGDGPSVLGLGPEPLIWRQTSRTPFRSWSLDASRGELGSGHGSLADAIRAASELSRGDQPAVAIRNSGSWYHLHGLQEQSRTAGSTTGEPTTVEGPRPFHLTPAFEAHTYRDNAYPVRRLEAIVDGDHVVGITSRDGQDLRFGPLTAVAAQPTPA